MYSWEDTGKNLLNRLSVHLDQKGLIPECQCGFRKDKGKIYMIFTARQLQEKCQEQNVDLYAFGTVSCDVLWKIMAKFCCPPRFIATVRHFHDDMHTCVQNDGDFSAPFEATNGVKHGCVMAPTLIQHEHVICCLFRTVTLAFQSGTVLMANIQP